MLSFKEFIFLEDVFARNGELFAAVNSSTTLRPSTPNSISTNLRPLGHQKGLTRGLDVFYAFNYKPSDADDGSTNLIKSLKGSGPFKLSDARRDTFVAESAKHMAKQFNRLHIQPDVIVAPNSSSPLVSLFAADLARELGVKASHISAFKKTRPELPEDREEAIKHVLDIYIDQQHMDEKFHGDLADRKHAERELALAIIRSIRNTGHIEAKKLPKMYAKFVKNIMVSALHGEDEYSLMDKSVMVVDDVLSSGSTMSDMFRICKDFGAVEVIGATLFARTAAEKT